MVPWSIRWVMNLPSHAKLCEVQRNTHTLLQLIWATMPDVPHRTPVPQLPKRMLNTSPMPPMHIIVPLLPRHQKSIFSSNEWHNDTNPSFISTVKPSKF